MQTVERPRFRQDLVAELIEDGSTRFIDVADPDSGHMFRFYEVEYSLACAMDGERDVNGIVKWAEEELGLKPSQQEVRTVISTLGELGYLESGKAAMAAATEPAAAAVAAPAASKPAERPTPQPPSRPSPPPTRPKTPPAGTPAVKKPAAPAQPEAFNRWDQPTAMGDADEYGIEPGVVTGGAKKHVPSVDVELGNAGARVAARGQDLPASDDMELGAPGAKGAPMAARGRGVDVELGNAGGGFDTDLAADMAISPADVKAAVRASQVMKAAEIPPELAAEAGIEVETPKPVAKPVEAPKPVAKPAEKPAEKQPRLQSRADETPPPEKKPVPMPVERPVIPKAPMAPSSGPSPILLVLLVLVVLGAGGFAIWKFVLNKKKGTETTQTPPTQPVVPTPPPPPPVESAKLALETSPPEEIKSASVTKIAVIIPTDTEVKEGDVVAKLDGHKPSGDKVASLEKEIAIFQGQLADEEKARDAAANDIAKKPHETKILGLNAIIKDRNAKLAEARPELDKFVIRSPGAGKVTTVVKANTKVTPTDIIATLQREPMLVATFKTAGEVTAGARVLLANKADATKKLSCTVASTGADGAKIACKKDAAPEGTEVTFAGPDTSSPDEQPSENGAGSAEPAKDGSAAEPAKDGSAAGSAEPAKGSGAEPGSPGSAGEPPKG